MRILPTPAYNFLVALALITLPVTASASLFGDVVEGVISNGEADPNAVLTQFTSPTATVAENVVEFTGGACVGTDIAGSFGITVDVHGESFAVAITNEGPSRTSFDDVSMFEVTLASLGWIGAPDGFVAGVSNADTNPSTWATSFEPHAITVLCDGSGAGEWAHQETREWTFEIETGGHSTGAEIIHEECLADANGTLVRFDIHNINLPPIAKVSAIPLPQPADPACVISSCTSPTGWTCLLDPPVGGATWSAGGVAGEIQAGTTKIGFELVAPWKVGGCCYTFRFFDSAGVLLFELDHCFPCDPPVPVESSTWGQVKSKYR